MIEFTGYLSETARKYYERKCAKNGRNLFVGAMLIVLPFLLIFAYKNSLWSIVPFYIVLMIIVPFLFYIPKRKSEAIKYLPKLIYTEDEYIICVAEKFTEERNMNDVKAVKDHGEFYELIFPFGKVSEKFICQKSLLTKGSLIDFENNFRGKMVN